MKKVKLMFYIYSLGGGGIQRFLFNFLKNIDYDKFEIVLVVIKKEGKYKNSFPPQVKIVEMNVRRIMFSLRPLVKLVKEHEPDVLISSANSINVISIAAARLSKTGTKVVIREAQHITKDSTKRHMKYLMKKIYPFADNIVVLSNKMRDELISILDINPKLVNVIPNSVDLEAIITKANQHITVNENKKTIVSVGRLTYQKNFELLIRSVKKMPDLRNVEVLILGEGELHDELEELIRQSDLEDTVKLLGFQSNPYKYLKNADLFVLTSRYEGVSNAYLEALALSVPVVTTQGHELIENGKNGLIVKEDEESISEALNEMISNRKYKDYCRDNMHLIQAKLDVKKMASSYENVILRTHQNVEPARS